MKKQAKTIHLHVLLIRTQFSLMISSNFLQIRGHLHYIYQTLPSYVISTLNLEADFQIISNSTLQTRWKNWFRISNQIKEIIRNSNKL